MTIPYTVSQNVSGGPRTGRIRFAWTGGGGSHTVYQDGSAIISSFTMTDPFRSGNSPTTECHFRSTATPCTFTATTNMPGGNYVFTWTATYFYGTQKTTTQTGASNQFTITDACGGTDSTATGNPGDLECDGNDHRQRRQYADHHVRRRRTAGVENRALHLLGTRHTAPAEGRMILSSAEALHFLGGGPANRN